MTLLAVGLHGTGWHPAAWRFATRPAPESFGLRYWADAVRGLDRAGADLITLADDLVPPGDPVTTYRGQLDAVQLAAALAPLTTSTGLVAEVTTTHAEPFHVSTGIATVDIVSEGRAGWLASVSDTPVAAALFGRRPADEFDPPLPDSLLAEAADAIEVVRRLWDSWEDGAIIKDVATGRYLDRDRLHHIRFDGVHFSVLGPSVTPRSPQGQPVVAVAAAGPAGYDLAARDADVVFTAPASTDGVADVLSAVRAAQDARTEPSLRVFGDVAVFLDESDAAAATRRARWDELSGVVPRVGDPLVFAGTPAGLADLLGRWAAAGLDGFRLLPASTEHDGPAISGGVLPELRARGLIGDTAAGTTLRGRLGLGRPASRYAA